MRRDGKELILDTQEEIDVLWAGADLLREPNEYISSVLEEDLAHATEMRVPMGENRIRIFPKQWPEFRFQSENVEDAKKALENVIILNGFSRRTRRQRRIAHSILGELARAEEFST